MSNEHKKNDFKYQQLSFSLIIISDSRYNQLQKNEKIDDLTIPLVKDLLTKWKHKLYSVDIIPDEAEFLKRKLRHVIESLKPNIIITSGGTGISKRDITIETMLKLFTKELKGFGELFRYLSYKQIGPTAILSRATAGIYLDTLIFNLPGSPKAVELALSKIILKMAPHAMAMLLS
ncbi:MAG: MogA/MoaB family molybdenum cofactor biosynthesis protein [Candidatus Helarchaeota archaeon]